MHKHVKTVLDVMRKRVHCQCEHGDCIHTRSCPYMATTVVTFPGAGTYALCTACEATYTRDGEAMETLYAIDQRLNGIEAR